MLLDKALIYGKFTDLKHTRKEVALESILQWLGYVIFYIFSPDEAATIFLNQFQLHWLMHELWMFLHHAWIIAAEVMLIMWVRRKPGWALAIWRFVQWSWYYLRRAGQWLRRVLHLPHFIRLGRLRKLENENGGSKRLTLRDMFLTAATPYIAKLATIAMVFQWREHKWRGFLAVWIGGCLRIAAYPFIGKWVFAIVGVYLFVRLWQFAKWPIPRWLRMAKSQEEKDVP